MAKATLSTVSKGSKVSGNTPIHTAVAVSAFVITGIQTRLDKGSNFYKTALDYHRKLLTAFPRARNNATRAALTMEQATEVFNQHDKFILSSGNKEGQAMFDVFMMDRKNY